MAEDLNAINVKFSGQSAINLNTEIKNDLDIVNKEYSEAMADFEIIKDAFIANQEITSKFNEIHTTGVDEVGKITNSLQQMIDGITNISQSWEDVSSEVLTALNSYTSGSENNQQ